MRPRGSLGSSGNSGLHATHWYDRLMESISGLLAKRGLTRIAKQVGASAKPSLLLTVQGKSADPCNRLGGHPNLPDEVSWPMWQGKPLPFVAQFFFYEGGQRAWGFKPEDKGTALAIYSATPLSDHAPRSIPDEIPREVRFTSVRLDSGSTDISLPDPQDQFMESLGLSADERNNYWEFLDERGEQGPEAIHRVGGYPKPIQGTRNWRPTWFLRGCIVAMLAATTRGRRWACGRALSIGSYCCKWIQTNQRK